MKGVCVGQGFITSTTNPFAVTFFAAQFRNSSILPCQRSRSLRFSEEPTSWATPSSGRPGRCSGGSAGLHQHRNYTFTPSEPDHRS